MEQILIVGRGGEGGKKLSKLIAQAAFLEGYIGCQSFALYGAERRGAKVLSFVRLDKTNPIEIRGYIEKPNWTIILNDTFFENGMTNAIANSSKQLDCITIDATKIAMDCFGKNIVNTTMFGAFAKVTGLISLKSAQDAIQHDFSSLPQKIIDKNVKACNEGYEEFK